MPRRGPKLSISVIAWIVKTGEPIPYVDSNARLMRSGMLARHLEESGWDVVFVTSIFAHQAKKHRQVPPGVTRLTPRLSLLALESPGYSRNVSLSRIWDHRVMARDFERRSRALPAPDVIHAAMPTIDLAVASARVARLKRCALVVDVRDNWPEVFLDVLPASLRPIGRMLLAPQYSRLRFALGEADAVTAHTRSFLELALRVGSREKVEHDTWFPFTYPLSSEDGRIPLDVETEHFLQSGELRLLYSGNLGTERAATLLGQFLDDVAGIDAALAARCRFIIAGDGGQVAKLRARYATQRHMRFVGWQDSAQLARLRQRCEVGVLPYAESQDFVASIPNKVVEYLAGGLAVLTSLGSGETATLLRESNCGRFYGLPDQPTLAESLHELLEFPSHLNKHRAAARALFSSRFAPERVLAAMESHIRTVIAARAR